MNARYKDIKRNPRAEKITSLLKMITGSKSFQVNNTLGKNRKGMILNASALVPVFVQEIYLPFCVEVVHNIIPFFAT